MRNLLLVLGILFFGAGVLFGQHTINGKVTIDGEPIPGAFISISEKEYVSDKEGKFVAVNLPTGSYTINVEFSYLRAEERIYLESDKEIEIELNRRIDMQEVVVEALRADKSTPVAYTNMSEERISEENVGPDVPYVLKWQPSMVVSSDAGTGIGYTSMRIRGSDPTRINVTVNGIPYNDSESQGVFWVNMPDILASADNVQIQRGVGTSTQGAGAFGGSVNISTLGVRENAYGEVSGSVGSFNTLKASVSAGTGLIDDKFVLEGRVSGLRSEGYIDRASADLFSYYGSAGYLWEESMLKAIVFSGSEVTYQAWNGLPYQLLDSDRTYNSAGTEKPGEPYENQVDDYNQTHYQLHYSYSPSSLFSANMSLHYTRGYGFFEEYEANQDLTEYGISPRDSINSSDLIRRRWLDNHFYGTVFSAVYKPFHDLKVTFGGGWNQYRGAHFGEVIDVIAFDYQEGDRYYDNDAIKDDFNIYGKLNYRFSSVLNAYLDLQYRTVGYEFTGLDSQDGELISVDQKVVSHFFNPKAGITMNLDQNSRVFAGFGIAHKEPNRDDYTESSPDSRPVPEKLYDVEFGYTLERRDLNIRLNSYLMYYKDQLVLNGQINDVGAFSRVNVDNSYRLGLEMYGAYSLLANMQLSAGATISRNKILDYTNYVDVWDDGSQQRRELGDTDISFSPSLIAQAGIRYRVFEKESVKGSQNLTLEWQTKFIGKQYIDNTMSDLRSLPSYTYTDVQILYSLPFKGDQSLELNLMLNNIFNSLYVSNAWAYQFVSQGYDPREDIPSAAKGNGNNYSQIGYYPQAGFNALFGITYKF